LDWKKPDSVIPISRNCFGVRRFLGFGFKSLLKGLKIEDGIDPREADEGGGWGGFSVAKGGCDGLKTV
jgi:hypothetical protein